MNKINRYWTIVSLLIFTINPLSAQWVQVGSFGGVVVTAIVIKDSTIFVGTGGNGIFSSSNIDYRGWSNGRLPGYSIMALAASDSFLFAGTNSIPGGIFKMNYSEINWINTISMENTYFHAFLVRGSKIYAGTTFASNNGVYRSTDNGRNWTKIGIDFEVNTQALIFKDTIFFAATDNGVYKSADEGMNWIKSLNVNSPDAFAIIDSTLFVGTRWDGVYLSTDNGINWSPVNSGLLNTQVSTLVTRGSHLFAATTDGMEPSDIYHSTDNGKHWYNTNLWVRDIWALALKDEYLYAGGGIGGLYRRPISEFTEISIEETRLPQKFSLQQNYPNPFNPTTLINFSLPKTCFVTLKIYNALGKEVRTLISTEKTVGNHSLEFNGSQLASGIYFYQLIAGNFTETKKFILLK